MSDDAFREMLAELEGELDEREREELEARLALAADPVDPDPRVRERILERVRRETPRRDAPPARRGIWRVAAPLAAGAVIAASATYLLLAPPSPPPPQGDALAELEDLIAEQDGEMATLEHELADARDALSVLTAERVERLDLVSSADPAASGRVYWDWDEYSCYFVSEGLPAAGGGHTYVLWLYTDEDEVLRAGSFAGDGGTPATFFAMLPKEMGHVVRAVVTREVEPPGAEPAGDVLLAGSTPTG